MKTRKWVAVILAALAALTLLAGCSSGGEKKIVVGICQLAEYASLDAATAGFKRALTEKLGDRVTFKESNAQGELTNCTTIVNGFISAKVDLWTQTKNPAAT